MIVLLDLKKNGEIEEVRGREAETETKTSGGEKTDRRREIGFQLHEI